MITPLMHGGSLDDRLLLSDNAFERLRRLGFGGDACLDWQRRLSAMSRCGPRPRAPAQRAHLAPRRQDGQHPSGWRAPAAADGKQRNSACVRRRFERRRPGQGA